MAAAKIRRLCLPAVLPQEAADGDLLCIVTGRWWRNIRRLGGSKRKAPPPNPFTGGNDVIPRIFRVHDAVGILETIV